MLNFRLKEVRQLLHNKFVVILGDSIQRSVYKDLIRLLQNDSLLTSSQMKAKGNLRFENDRLIEGGVLGGLHNGTHYREVRQYRTSHHLVRFYFLTRVYSPYLESILDDFRTGPQPDVLILNSCVWDISRLPAQGFLRNDVIEGNFHGATLAGFHLFDVMDLHYHFRLDLRNRAKDGVHWNNVVHRRITSLLLAHVAGAWGVALPDPKRWEGPVWENRLTVPFGLLGVLLRPPLADLPEGFLDQRGARRPDPPGFHEDSFLFLSDWESAEPFSGFSSFEDSHIPPPFHLDGPGRENRPAVPLDLSRPPLADPPEGFPDRRGTRGPDPPVFHEGSFLILSDWESAEPFSGFTSFEDSRVPPPFRLDGLPRPPLADPPEGFPDQRGTRGPDPPVFHEDSFLVLSDWESAEPFSGFSSFEDSRVPPPFRLDGPGRENRPAVPLDLSRPPLADPPEGFPDRRGARGPDPPVFHEGSFLILSDWESAEPFSGFSSFEDSRVPPPFRLDGPVWENRLTVPFGLLGVLLRPPLADLPEGFLDQRGARRPDPPGFHEDSFLFLSDWESAEPFSGFTSFEDSRVSPPFRLDAGALDNFHHFERPDPSLFPPYPSPEEGSLPPRSSCCRKRARLVVEHPQGYVMRQQTVHVRDETPYQRGRKFLYKRW